LQNNKKANSIDESIRIHKFKFAVIQVFKRSLHANSTKTRKTMINYGNFSKQSEIHKYLKMHKIPPLKIHFTIPKFVRQVEI
jgi:hypothetical protein